MVTRHLHDWLFELPTGDVMISEEVEARAFRDVCLVETVCSVQFKVTSKCFSSLQFSPLTDWVIGETRGMIQQRSFFQSFLYEAIASSSGMGKDVHSKC